jgi:peroxiredoxin
MKTLLTLALTVSILLAGCSGQQPPANETQDTPEATVPSQPNMTAEPSEATVATEDSEPPPMADTAAEQPESEQASKAEKAPSITVVDAAALKEELVKHEGKVMVLNFWATWCPPCVEEMPEFVEFFNESDPDELALISLSADDPALKDKAVKAFQKNHGLPFPILILNEQNPDAFYDALGTEMSGALPTTLVYDRAGKVVKHWEGAVTLEDLEEATDPLLEG